MASVQTVYIIAGGDWMQDVLNGVAAFFKSPAWDSLLAMGTAISVCVAVISYIKSRNVLDLVKWAAFYVLVVVVLVGGKRSVQVVDLSNPAGIYVVDNVPVGIAAPFSLITRVGAGMAQVYDKIFARPDALTYTKSGMMFGAALAGGTTDYRFSDPEEQRIFSDYVRNCVVGDIMLNHKYSMGDLMESADPYNLVLNPPGGASPLRGLYDKNRNFMTCQAASTWLQGSAGSFNGSKIGVYFQRAERALHGFTNGVFGGGSGVGTSIYATMLGDSYNYFHKTSMTATNIIRHNVVLNGLRQGLDSFAAESDDTSGLLNVATQTSMAKMRMSQATSASVATHTLPIMHTVLMGMAIALFPILITIAVISSLSFTVLKGYIYSIAYLQMWPLLYSILNHTMNFYLRSKLDGAPVVLSTFDQVQNTYSDIATTAGWLALSIPFIAWGMVKGLGQVMSSAGQYLGQTMQSASTQSSSQAVDGTWAFENMQTNNVQANKWDTNFGLREGQMSTQVASGATSTLTASGQQVFDTNGAMSKLPVDIAIGKTATSSWQQQARDAMAESQSMSNSLSHTANLATSQMSQWSQQRGNSDTTVAGFDTATGRNFTKALNTIQSIGARIARDENVSLAEGIRAAATKSQDMSFGAGGSVQASADTNRQLLGKFVGLATGGKLAAEAHLKGEYTGRSGSSHGTSSDLTHQGGTSKGLSAQESKDFRDALDVLSSARVTDSGSHTDNASGSLANQLASTFSDLKSKASQYNDAQTRSHEYAQLASYAENHSASINENYAQEFAGYVMQRSPQNAEAILTNTSSPEVRAERNQLVQEFVEDKIKPQLLQEFEQNKGHTGDGMGGVSAPAGGFDLQGEFREQKGGMENMATQNGVKADGVVAKDVQNQRSHVEAGVSKDRNTVISAGESAAKEYKDLQTEHEQGNKRFNDAKKTEDDRQTWYGGDWSAGEKLEQIKGDLKNKISNP